MGWRRGQPTRSQYGRDIPNASEHRRDQPIASVWQRDRPRETLSGRNQPTQNVWQRDIPTIFDTFDIYESTDIPCFIDIVESVSLAPGKRLTYNIRWNGGDSMANKFVVDWYAHPNWEALGIDPLASTEILPLVTFMPEEPFPQSKKEWEGTITFDVPLNITYTQLFAVLSLAKT